MNCSMLRFNLNQWLLSTQMLHDPHTIPEPLLVLSGLSYTLPLIAAQTSYDRFTNGFLLLTTIGFHGTRQEWLFYLDCLAILNFLIRSYRLVRTCSRASQALFSLSVTYCLVSYFVGYQFSILSFDPDWNTQMMFHSFMHVSTSYASYRIINEITNRDGDSQKAACSQSDTKETEQSPLRNPYPSPLVLRMEE